MNQLSFWILKAPESQNECRSLVVPLSNYIFKLFPPLSPLGNVWLYSETECNGWWISPTTWIRYLENMALWAVVLLISKDSTFTAFCMSKVALTAVDVMLMIENTPSSTYGLYNINSTYRWNASHSTIPCYIVSIWDRQASKQTPRRCGFYCLLNCLSNPPVIWISQMCMDLTDLILFLQWPHSTCARHPTIVGSIWGELSKWWFFAFFIYLLLCILDSW